MAASRTDRLTALSGIVAVACIAVSAFATPMPPDVDKPIGEITSYFADHHDALLASALIGIIAVPFVVWFISGMRRILARSEGEGAIGSLVFFGAGLLTVGLALVQGGLQAGLTQRIAPTGNEPVIRSFYEFNNMFFALLSFGSATFLVGGSYVMVATGAVNRWLGWWGLLAATAGFIGGSAILLKDTSGVGVLGFAGFLGFLVWILAGSLIIFLGKARATPA